MQEFAPAFGFAADEPVQETDLPDLDFVAMASGMGCKGLRVAKARVHAAVLAGALASHVPVIVDIQMA